MSSSTCHFNLCKYPALPDTVKCRFHRHRAMCLAPGCHNQVYARGLCTRHGGKRLCAFDGCHRHARLKQFCSSHAIDKSKKMCAHLGCTKQANVRDHCVRHGGRRQCHVSGCGTHARSGGYCRRHSKYGQPSTAIGDDSPFDVDVELLDLDWIDGDHSPMWIDDVKPIVTFVNLMQAIVGCKDGSRH
ncbi:Aste57867_23439 [Aphanomyces stellatus]|uniref:Aste57867_23439 protein n=1 Tax=Aphanomyces stellatus TaxID=120398 RepID=A0A485LN34_9STRA|nr:hypothetical protein As57867_023368 [Aphanomyces stellatus]VFU00085.1 Aste57867_23439 [Aphanomyces stellatus]